jgi:hypothetical protein
MSAAREIDHAQGARAPGRLTLTWAPTWWRTEETQRLRQHNQSTGKVNVERAGQEETTKRATIGKTRRKVHWTSDSIAAS